jgi:hypothetical protein
VEWLVVPSGNLAQRLLQKAAFAAFFICSDNAVSAYGVSKNSEFAQMQGAERMLANLDFFRIT